MEQAETLQDKVSANIRVVLAMRDMSKRSLAREMHIAPSTLVQKMSGTTRWNVDDIEKAADALDVSPAALVAGHGFEPWTSGL